MPQPSPRAPLLDTTPESSAPALPSAAEHGNLGRFAEFVWREMRLEFWHASDEEIDFPNLELVPAAAFLRKLWVFHEQPNPALA